MFFLIFYLRCIYYQSIFINKSPSSVGAFKGLRSDKVNVCGLLAIFTYSGFVPSVNQFSIVDGIEIGDNRRCHFYCHVLSIGVLRKWLVKFTGVVCFAYQFIDDVCDSRDY